MTIFQAVVLGIVQGLTEFLPVSSSGHLVLFPRLLGWPEQPLVFDTTMHLGTGLTLLFFFWNDLQKIADAFIKDLFRFGLRVREYTAEARITLAIIIGIVPAGILGVLFGDLIENTFRSVTYVAVFLTAGSVLMLAAELSHSRRQGRSEEGDGSDADVTPYKGFIIGIFQSFALLPGISRSGSTISGGMFLGLNREEAARFSFLLSLPIILLAGFYQLGSSLSVVENTLSWPVILAGFLGSFVSGLLAIKILLAFVRKHSLYLFIVYRLTLALYLVVVFII